MNSKQVAESANQTNAAAEGQADILKSVSNVTSQLLTSYEEALAESNKQIGFFVKLVPGLLDTLNKFKSRTCVMGCGHNRIKIFVSHYFFIEDVSSELSMRPLSTNSRT